MLLSVDSPTILATRAHVSAAWEAPIETASLSAHIVLPPEFEFFTGHRKATFLAGRFCAARAIQMMNPLIDPTVQRQSDGSPKWPEGLVGSITHTEGFASAAVASRDTCRSIGIDSEKMIDLETLRAARQVILLDNERRLFKNSTLSEQEMTLLLFSAKESIFKCLHPLVRRKIDYTAICIAEIDVHRSTFHFHLRESLHADLPKAFSSQGRYAFSRGCVHTAVELFPTTSSLPF